MFVINRPNYVLSVFMDIDVKNWHNKTIELQNISCGRSTNDDEAKRTSISIGNYQQGNRVIVSPLPFLSIDIVMYKKKTEEEKILLRFGKTRRG